MYTWSMLNLSPNLRVGVLRGGPSPEYEVSLQSGAHILRHLESFSNPLDIFISKDGSWHMHGIPRQPERILKHVDVVWNALHGTYGEDGGVQEVLEYHGMPYTGSTRVPSAVSMNKYMTKEHLKKMSDSQPQSNVEAPLLAIKTPLYVLVRNSDSVREKAQDIFQSIPHPLVVKPASGGSSLGLYMVQTYSDLLSALTVVLSAYPAALVEEFISGREATCGVLEQFRNSVAYALPVIEIIPPKEKKLFDYHSKYSGESQEICPGNFSTEEKKEIERVATFVHQNLGLSHYSRSDFIVSPRRGIYFLEVNTLPGLTRESLLPKSLASVGVTMKEFITHILSLALERK